MTREEEIKKQANKSAAKYADSIGAWSHHRMGFINGAEWADRTMIDKACEWLRAELDKEEELHYVHVHGFDKERREIFLEDFRKAMKGD